MRMLMKWSIAAGIAAVAGYGSCVAAGWFGYGRPRPPKRDEADALLDAFMPQYDVVERQHIEVAAPAAMTFGAARNVDLMQSPVTRAIFRAREVVLGADRHVAVRPRGIIGETESLGWRVLAENPGREIVMGCATRPWEPNVVFRPLTPDEFRTFAEPGYVKIAWTLRADPIGEDASIFRHETRAWPTDAAARRKFRTYWALFSPGIMLIRWIMLEPVRRAAELEAAAASASLFGGQQTYQDQS